VLGLVKRFTDNSSSYVVMKTIITGVPTCIFCDAIFYVNNYFPLKVACIC